MKRTIVAMALAILLFALTILNMGSLTQWFVSFWLTPQAIDAVARSQSPDLYQGTILQRSAIRSSGMLPVYGSSEFSAYSIYHPSALFNERPTGFTPLIIGRGGSQDLIHVLNIAAQGEVLRGKKVAVILSPQWFFPGGLSPEYFAMNFSALQAYHTFYESDLPPEIKIEIANRLLSYPYIQQNYPILSHLLAHYQRTDLRSKLLNLVYQPAGQIEMAALELQDAAKSVLRLLIPIKTNIAKDNHVTPAKPLKPWATLKQEANDAAKKAVTTNSFGIIDPYYNKYIAPDLSASKDSKKSAKLYPSQEYQDLQLLMKVLQAENIRALFVIVPVNGFWYDYTGFPLEERTGYYQRIKQVIETKGFQAADFSDHEYDLYFLQDIMHLGMKGWVYVDEAMDRFYHRK